MRLSLSANSYSHFITEEDEVLRKAEEEARQKAEEEARLKAEDEAQQKAEGEARWRDSQSPAAAERRETW